MAWRSSNDFRHRSVEAIRREQALSRERNDESAKTKVQSFENEMRVRKVKHEAETQSTALQSEEAKANNALQELIEAGMDLRATAARNRLREEEDERLRVQEKELAHNKAELEAETAAAVARFDAAKGGFTEAVLALSNDETMVKVAEALSAQKLIGGQNVAEVLGTVFEGTALGKRLGGMLEGRSNGKEHRQKQPQ